MLSAPAHGWSTLDAGPRQYHISYLTDVPAVWPRTLAHAIRENVPAALYADMEGSELYLVLYHGFAAAMVDGDDLSVRPLDISWKDFCQAVLDDFRKDFDAWVRWNPDAEFEKDLSRRANMIRIGLQDLETAMKTLR